jgi:hypothetical protein
MSKPVTWGYILLSPKRPKLAAQLGALAALGISTRDDGPVWRDEIKRGVKGPNAGRRQLEGRNDLLNIVGEGDRVVVADAYCLGLSEEDVRRFVGELYAKGATVTVGPVFNLKPGDDMEALLAEVARKKSAANVALFRERKGIVPKRKRKTST